MKEKAAKVYRIALTSEPWIAVMDDEAATERALSRFERLPMPHSISVIRPPGFESLTLPLVAMRPPSTSVRPADRVNMTPMIDVVFLLIIFFLVSSHLARREIRYPVELAQARTGDRVDPRDAFVTVTMDAQHQLRMGGDVVTLPEMQQRIQRRRDHESDDVPVRLRIDRSARYEFVRPVLTKLTDMGVRRVSIASEASR